MSKIETEYKGNIITFKEYDETWECEVCKKGNKSLNVVKRAIDKHIKDESIYKNFPAIKLLSRYGNTNLAQAVTITSVTEDGDVWISFDNAKNREKISKGATSSLIKNCPENMAILDMVKRQIDISQKAQAERVSLEESLERVFPAEKT